ncbi:MAG: hypothetical protein KA248_05430 [Kiritimatiellae bacterium]|nr:hypothetical protein [Kiritimatiellia bacterium]
MNASKLQIPLTAAGVLAFVYFFPRAVIRWLGESSPWTPYLYLYGLGLVTFLIGLRIILKSRACQPGRGRDSFWLGVLLAGYALVAGLHAAWILAALYIPFKGGG